MPSLPQDKLDALETRFQYVEAALSGGAGPDEFVKFSKEHAELAPIVGEIRAYNKAVSDRAEAETLLKSGDKDMAEMAQAEIEELDDKIDALFQAVRILLLPKDEADEKSIILEIRGGTGGDEAALFAGDLFRMYERYAANHGWKVSVMEESPGEMGGYKEIIANVSGKGVYARMKFESGVHRVQRVPATEGSGRIHTSAATVAVLPEVEDIDIEIRTEDIRIDTMRASGAGGQHVNTTDSAIRITHVPSGIIVACQQERSQHKNRATAMAMLKSRLYEAELQKREEAANAQAASKTDIGWGHQIRSYVLQPYQMVKDLRTGVESGQPALVLDGDVDQFMEAALAQRVGVATDVVSD